MISNKLLSNSHLPILGIGNDIIEVERIRKSVEKYGERLLDRLLTQKEKAYCLEFRDPALRIAGRFAAKEAIAKALGCGFGENIAWREIEILNNLSGKPEVHLAASLNDRFRSPQILVSISHCKLFATAIAIRYHPI